MKPTPSLLLGLCCLLLCLPTAGCTQPQPSDGFALTVRQITSGDAHQFFGYIGQSKTIPWNASGRYILGLRTDFHDRLPGPDDPAQVLLIDTQEDYRVQVVDASRGWNHQQGTMFYWNPDAPDTQFFFNDRDPATGKVFTVLFDMATMERVREYRFDDMPVANGGVAPTGGSFLAINYARMARLRPVTGYQGTTDWTEGVAAPADDGIFKVDIETGDKTLLVSFQQLADALRPRYPDIDQIPLFINHTLWNRPGDRIWFFARGNWNGASPGRRINVSFTIQPDGTGLTMHDHIGGHPEWGEGYEIMGVREDRQIVYDVNQKEVVRQLGTPEIFPDPEGDIALSPDGRFLVNGYRVDDENFYVVYRLEDGAYARSSGLSCGGYTRGDLRIDAAPRWNRTSDALLVPGWTDAGTRQMHVIEMVPR